LQGSGVPFTAKSGTPASPFWVRIVRITSVSVRVRAASCLVGGGPLSECGGEDGGPLLRPVSVRRSTLLTLALLALVAFALAGAAVQLLRGERPPLLGGW
jgi:hypothetical protein